MATHSAAQSPYVNGGKDESSTGETPLDSTAPTLLEEKGITSPLPGFPATNGKDEDGMDDNTPKRIIPTLPDVKGTVPSFASENGRGKRDTTPGNAPNSFPRKEDMNDDVKDTGSEDDIVYPNGLALGFIVVALVLTIFLVGSCSISSIGFIY